MNCNKCGRNISDEAKTCPHCGAEVYITPEVVDDNNIPHGGDEGGGAGKSWFRCPVCGSHRVTIFRSQGYDPGCGCIGALLFGWWGLLLGLLGKDKNTIVCHNCGARTPMGVSNSGCGGCFFFIIVIILLSALFNSLVR